MSADSKTRGDQASRTRPISGAAEAARLRERIDRGGAGDKVAFSDPAAAPLGTDAEAGGAPPTRAEAAIATASESRRDTKADRKRGPADLQGPQRRPGMVFVATLVVLTLTALLIAILV